MQGYHTQQGLIRYIIIFAVIAAILAYFGINARDVVESKPFQVVFAWGLDAWNAFGAPLVGFLWDTVIVDFVWDGLLKFFAGAEDITLPTEGGMSTTTAETSTTTSSR